MKNLAEIRKSRGVSQHELAAMVGMTAATISRLERGCTDARIGTAVKLASALDIKVELLIKEKEETL